MLRGPASINKPQTRLHLIHPSVVFAKTDLVRRVEPPTGGTPWVIPPQIAMVFDGYRDGVWWIPLKNGGIHPTSILFLTEMSR